MKIQDEVIIDFLNDNNENMKYIIPLYKNYKMINKMFMENNKSRYKILKTLEDEIYKIDSKPMTERSRIKLELNQLKEKIGDGDSDLNDYIIQLESELEKIEFSNLEEVTDLKKQISILQSKVDIQPSFFYASYLAFEDLYRNLYINYIKKQDSSNDRSLL